MICVQLSHFSHRPSVRTRFSPSLELSSTPGFCRENHMDSFYCSGLKAGEANKSTPLHSYRGSEEALFPCDIEPCVNRKRAPRHRRGVVIYAG